MKLPKHRPIGMQRSLHQLPYEHGLENMLHAYGQRHSPVPCSSCSERKKRILKFQLYQLHLPVRAALEPFHHVHSAGCSMKH
ncbi:hypothetical protein M404DRAFT_377192 [Pisolithus tinctorius Marx 270]|uniref:Uncharacterized protein n=1 Tax=Pisolithus tinctorius Marx 270 TaxID=870435 RepID=A0A0C3JFS9_PISTI|nr:hypothetical protein M404DRAFT_377192 [Pisolithus tinctorius Marx 270]